MEIGLAIAVMLLGAGLVVQSFRLWLAKNSLLDSKKNFRQCVRDYEKHIEERVAAETYSVDRRYEGLKRAISELLEKHK